MLMPEDIHVKHLNSPKRLNFMKLCFPIHQSRTAFSSLGMFKISISENPLSYHNLQSPLPPHFSGSWHYCWHFFRFMTPIAGKLFCPISFIYFSLSFMSFCIHCRYHGTAHLQLPCSLAHVLLLLWHRLVQTPVSTVGLLVHGPLFQSAESCWQKFKDQHHGWRVQSHLMLNFLCSSRSVSFTSIHQFHQFTPVHTSLLLYSPVTAFYWTENSSTRLGACQIPALLLTRYLILDTQLTFATDVNLKSHSTGGKEFGST